MRCGVLGVTGTDEPALGNAVFPDGRAAPLARFAELFALAMMAFDVFNVQFLQDYLAHGWCVSCLAVAHALQAASASWR